MTIDYYTQVLAALAIIGGLLFLFYTLSLKYKKQLFSGDLKVKDRLALNKQVSLVVVSDGKNEYLMGVSEKTIQVIQQYPSLEEMPVLKGAA